MDSISLEYEDEEAAVQDLMPIVDFDGVQSWVQRRLEIRPLNLSLEATKVDIGPQVLPGASLSSYSRLVG